MRTAGGRRTSQRARDAWGGAEGRRMAEPLYDIDFYQWTQTRAAALRAKDWAALDLG
jgi:Domain of unknown function DUF29